MKLTKKRLEKMIIESILDQEAAIEKHQRSKRPRFSTGVMSQNVSNPLDNFEDFDSMNVKLLGDIKIRELKNGEIPYIIIDYDKQDENLIQYIENAEGIERQGNRLVYNPNF